MNRKMTRFALAAKWGRLTISGSTGSPAIVCRIEADSSANSADSASALKPPPERRNNSRRVSGTGDCLIGVELKSVHSLLCRIQSTNRNSFVQRTTRQ